MSTFEVTIEEIEVLPHPNADALEMARVGKYLAVIPKGKYTTGDQVVYIPEQAVLPQELISFLGLDGKLSGKEKNRVKPVRLRGELSQGIVMSMDDTLDYVSHSKEEGQEHQLILSNGTPAFIEYAVKCGNEEDNKDIMPWGGLAFLLGITKWVPPIPVEMQGQLIHINSIVKWPDVENIKKYPDMFTPGELVQVSEKIHGTCCGMTYDAETDTFSVYSKGLSQQGLALVESEKNVYWRAVRKYGLEEKLRAICEFLNLKRVALFGEVYGQGVQDLGYGLDVSKEGPGFAAFDIWFNASRSSFSNEDFEDFMPPRVFLQYCEKYEIPTVPNLGNVSYDYDAIAKLASGQSLAGGDHIREGVVIRPCAEEPHATVIKHVNPDDETRWSTSRKIAKFVSDDYLTRKGGTEYE